MAQLSHPYMTTGKTTALTRWTFVCKVMSLLFNTLSGFVIKRMFTKGDPSLSHTMTSVLRALCSSTRFWQKLISRGFMRNSLCRNEPLAAPQAETKVRERNQGQRQRKARPRSPSFPSQRPQGGASSKDGEHVGWGYPRM